MLQGIEVRSEYRVGYDKKEWLVSEKGREEVSVRGNQCAGVCSYPLMAGNKQFYDVSSKKVVRCFDSFVVVNLLVEMKESEENNEGK